MVGVSWDRVPYKGRCVLGDRLPYKGGCVLGFLPSSKVSLSPSQSCKAITNVIVMIYNGESVS